jgi:hypothetical protein
LFPWVEWCPPYSAVHLPNFFRTWFCHFWGPAIEPMSFAEHSDFAMTARHFPSSYSALETQFLLYLKFLFFLKDRKCCFLLRSHLTICSRTMVHCTGLIPYILSHVMTLSLLCVNLHFCFYLQWISCFLGAQT